MSRSGVADDEDFEVSVGSWCAVGFGVFDFCWKFGDILFETWDEWNLFTLLVRIMLGIL